MLDHSSCDSTCDQGTLMSISAQEALQQPLRKHGMSRQVHEVYMYTPLTCSKPSKLAQSACFQRDSSIRSRAIFPIQRFNDADRSHHSGDAGVHYEPKSICLRVVPTCWIRFLRVLARLDRVSERKDFLRFPL